MQNPLLLILIVKRNRDYFSKAGTQNLFNEHGNTDKKASNAATAKSDNQKSVSHQRNNTLPDMDRQDGNSNSK